jgi:hypothetical protein
LELVESQGFAGRVHRIHIVRGLVQHVDSTLKVPRLGELLRDHGFLPPSARSKFIRALMAPDAGPSGEMLASHAGVPKSAVTAALRHQLQLKLGALFELPGPKLRFRVALRPPESPLTEIPLSPKEFLHGRRRGRDARDAGCAGKERAAPSGRDERSQREPRVRALQTLGLSEAATPLEIQRAFRTLARKLHPDSHPRATAGQRIELLRQFSQLSAAYHQLCA